MIVFYSPKSNGNISGFWSEGTPRNSSNDSTSYGSMKQEGSISNDPFSRYWAMPDEGDSFLQSPERMGLNGLTEKLANQGPGFYSRTPGSNGVRSQIEAMEKAHLSQKIPMEWQLKGQMGGGAGDGTAFFNAKEKMIPKNGISMQNGRHDERKGICSQNQALPGDNGLINDVPKNDMPPQQQSQTMQQDLLISGQKNFDNNFYHGNDGKQQSLMRGQMERQQEQVPSQWQYTSQLPEAIDKQLLMQAFLNQTDENVGCSVHPGFDDKELAVEQVNHQMEQLSVQTTYGQRKMEPIPPAGQPNNKMMAQNSGSFLGSGLSNTSTPNSMADPAISSVGLPDFPRMPPMYPMYNGGTARFVPQGYPYRNYPNGVKVAPNGNIYMNKLHSPMSIQGNSHSAKYSNSTASSMSSPRVGGSSHRERHSSEQSTDSRSTSGSEKILSAIDAASQSATEKANFVSHQVKDLPVNHLKMYPYPEDLIPSDLAHLPPTFVHGN